MFDDFDTQIQSDEKEWEYLEWCEIMKELEEEDERKEV